MRNILLFSLLILLLAQLEMRQLQQLSLLCSTLREPTSISFFPLRQPFIIEEFQFEQVALVIVVMEILICSIWQLHLVLPYSAFLPDHYHSQEGLFDLLRQDIITITNLLISHFSSRALGMVTGLNQNLAQMMVLRLAFVFLAFSLVILMLVVNLISFELQSQLQP